MIGIYQDEFLKYLQDNLGDPVRVTNTNIICRCPWCEYKVEKKHYHLYIALDAPYFHCFYADCNQSGMISKLLRKIEGKDVSSKFFDEEKVKESLTQKTRVASQQMRKYIYQLPPLIESKFPLKSLYVKKRLKFRETNLGNIKGLIFDIKEFLSLNQIPISPSLFRYRDFLQTNCIAFLTENQTKLYFRNIQNGDFKHWKYNLQESMLLDYYKLPGGDLSSKTIVLSEGIFDIFGEHIFDSLNIKDSVRLYACGFSTSYRSLIISIMRHEKLLRPNVFILSDTDVDLSYYKKMLKYNKRFINSLNVAYNKSGKDFNITPIFPHKEVITL